jgi:hypothetical protein
VFFPIIQPDSYADLIFQLLTVFNHSPVDGILVFDDASDKPMHVCSESTYQALIPKHRVLNLRVDVYYMTLIVNAILTTA